MSTPPSIETTVALLLKGQELLQREIDTNKREAEADLKRVKDDAEDEIKQVREKAEADNRRNAASIAALEAERTKALKWGVTTLGTAVLIMGGWIFTKVFTGEIKW